MDTTEYDEETADDQSEPIPRWWSMPYPNEPLYPVDLFVAAKDSRRRRARTRATQPGTRDERS